MNPGPPHPDNPQFTPTPLQFHMPQFMLGRTPNVAHGGGAEVLPCMYGQGVQAWSEYDKNCYENPVPSRYYTLEDLVEPPSSGGTPSRPFEFTDSPHMRSGGSSKPISPPTRTMDTENEMEPFPDVVPPVQPAYPQDLALAPYSHNAAAAIPALSFPVLSSLDPTVPLPPIPSNGLPLYSASGFDMLKMLGKVATRQNPKIMLGPVDMTCSFVVVDVRRYDAPIVYASPTFTRLTGYPEAEVLGRNCRFLQSPSGHVARGDERRFTAPDAVRHLQKCLLQEKECQASLINYRKDGGAFINLVTVIPVAADDCSDEITHHVGFQVDLAEQPNAILEKLRDGSYIVNYSNSASASGFASMFGHDVRLSRGVSQDMIEILRTGQPWALCPETGAKPVRDHERAALHAMLLENTDDFIHVVSLKGALLYVAPAVHRVLGYNPTELIGKSIADLCHPADVVPLMRELKEASTLPPPPTPAPPTDPAPLFALPQQQPPAAPKPVHLLFRARHKTAGFVWLEARGRLHVEQGKGRKAVVLVGRRTGVPHLRWGALAPGGPADAWGLVAPNGLVLSTGGGALGPDAVGQSLARLVVPEDARRVVDVLAGAACADREEVRSVPCVLLAGRRPAELLFYARPRAPGAPLPPRLVFQLRLAAPVAGAPPRRAPPAEDVLAELDTARATSWQYELTRLRFENQRMRDEVAALERGAALFRRASPVMASLAPLPAPLSAPAPVRTALPAAPHTHTHTHAHASLKRSHTGEIKLPELPPPPR